MSMTSLRRAHGDARPRRRATSVVVLVHRARVRGRRASATELLLRDLLCTRDPAAHPLLKEPGLLPGVCDQHPVLQRADAARFVPSRLYELDAAVRRLRAACGRAAASAVGGAAAAVARPHAARRRCTAAASS